MIRIEKLSFSYEGNEKKYWMTSTSQWKPAILLVSSARPAREKAP